VFLKAPYWTALTQQEVGNARDYAWYCDRNEATGERSDTPESSTFRILVSGFQIPHFFGPKILCTPHLCFEEYSVIKVTIFVIWPLLYAHSVPASAGQIIITKGDDCTFTVGNANPNVPAVAINTTAQVNLLNCLIFSLGQAIQTGCIPQW